METKLRTEYRRQFTRKCNTFEEIMASLPSKEAEIQQVITAYKSVREYREQLEKLDKIICEQILKDSEEEDLQKEFDDAEKYKERWLLVETKYEIFMNKQKQNPEHVNNNKHTAKNNLRLPMLEIPKFDGRLETWLPFWGQFKKIHEDAHLDPEDKFGYLLQSINPGTDARQLVESYPISPENYPKCIEHLKSRYAREDLQTQLYVRELLSLIMQREKHTNLTTLYDKISAQLRSLETLGVTKKNAAFILPMVESALPEECLKAWQRMGKHDNDMETELNNLLSFLHTEVEHNQRIEMARMNFNKEEYKESLPTASCLFTAKKTDQKTLLCIWCDKENHASLECYKLQKLTVEQRREVIQKKRACSVCLKRGHHFKNCRSFIKCLICGKKHSTVLCWSPKQDQKPSDEPKKESTSTTATASAKLQSTTATASSVKKSTTTLLQAVRVTIEHNGKKIPIRAVFDNGSQRTYVQDKLMKKLQIPISGQERLGHTLFGGNEMESKNYNLFNVKINSLDGSYSTQIEALGQDILCNNIPKYNVKALSNFAEIFKTNLIHLTDNDDPSDEVGLLIGADISGKFLTGQMIPLDDNGLVVVRTKLGWTLQGKQVSVNANNIVTTLFCSNLNNDLTGYWSLETLGIQDPAELKTKEAAADEVMTAFEETIRINEEDRYEVRLPFKTGQEDLLPNYNIARKRLDTMTQKIISSGIFHKYHGVFQEWLNLGIIEKVPDSEIDHDKGHYLPHRAVLKESSLTCAIRPVFDAAAKDKNGLCLNACLEKGLNLIDRIPNLLIGFRAGAIGVTADIQRAFLQISIPQDDRNYLKFLWWENESLQNIITYRHCRLVFGLTSSPFLLAATLMHHLNNTSGACAELLNRSWYVDNCLTSFDTEAETRKFIEEAKQIMQAAKFNLRMWVTSPMTINEAGKDEISVLGINWDTLADQLHCNTVNLPAVEDIKRVTKRELLSLTQRVYDPIGYTSPVMLVPKLIMQETWRRDLPWDDTLPSDLMKKFLEWYKELTYLNNCRIPRRLTAENLKESKLSLHLLCDASKDGYAAGVLLRAEYNNKVSVQLVSAKARVTPPKKVSIPRLELLAALIGSRLLSQIKENKMFKDCDTFCWTDSSVVLCWIKRELPLNNFVGNRIKEIRQHTNTNNWHHIPGTENWADLASRGCTAKTLRDCRWWEGPAWLRLASEQWPHSEVSVDECEVQAETKRTVCSTQVCVNGNLLERLQNYFSKYTKIVRTVAWILRFIHNMKNSTNKKKGEITFNEYSKAEKSVIRFIQESSKEYLGKECKNLTKFTDAEGLLKIKTKLTLSDFPELIRTPYLLPAKNPVVKLLVRQRHEQMQHAGTDQLIVDLRARFWIIGVRRLVRSVIHNCVVCKRYRSKPAQAPTAPLPLERITSAASFQNCGVDLAGPLILRNGEKCWIVIYTCAVYRAVHLELTLSLSTEAFIMTMRRFIARRCRPQLMLSDQGTNFHGTKNLINSLDWEEVQRHSTIRRIQWKMNAPTAAWWGGFWERLIRLMKDLLKRIIGRASLTYEEMQTTLCECEAVMNGRPLTYVNSDTGDCLEPLTPAHFLQPISQPTMEVCDFNQIDSNSLNSRVKYIQEIRAQFNERFKTEYLTSLIQRGKENNVNIKVGDVVLIETTDKKIRWPLGVVQKLITGKDGVGRTAEVKTALGTKIRPIQRLFNLEVSTEPTGNILPVLRPSSPINVQQAEQPAETSVADTSTDNQEQANSSDDAAQIPQSSRCGRQEKQYQGGPSTRTLSHRASIGSGRSDASTTTNTTSSSSNFTVDSLDSSIHHYRDEFEDFKCKMRIFGESLNLCKCIANDFTGKMAYMEGKLNRLEKRQKINKTRNNYTEIIKKNKELETKTKAFVAKLQKCGTEEEMREVAGRICKNYLHGLWKVVQHQEIKFRRISGGLSNFIYVVGLPDDLKPLYARLNDLEEDEQKAVQSALEAGDEPKQVLLRIYGQVHGERAMDAIVTESVIFTLLSERRLGPKLFGVFSGGRIEEFIPARALYTKELSEPAISMKIAEKTAAIHSMDIPLSKEPNFIWKSSYKWLKVIKEECFTNGLKGKNEIEQIAIKKLKEINYDNEIEWLKKYLLPFESPVVFCHNDLQEGNILILEGETQLACDEYEGSSFVPNFHQPTEQDESLSLDGLPEESIRSRHWLQDEVDSKASKAAFLSPVSQHRPVFEEEDTVLSEPPGEPKLYLIDFEYCAFNHRAFDIANHFQEWAYDYTNSEHPYFFENPDDWPTLEQKEIFIREYLKYYHANLAEDKQPVEPDIEAVNKLLAEVDAFALASHLFWTLWSIVNASKSQIPFGYWEYGQSRLETYLRLKQEVIKKEQLGLPQKRKIEEVDI